MKRLPLVVAAAFLLALPAEAQAPPRTVRPVHATSIREAEGAARSLSVELRSLQVRGPGDLASAFPAAANERAGAVLVLGDGLFYGQRGRIAELGVRHRLPTMFLEREHAEAGGLMAYGPDLRDNLRRAATFVDKILKGARPGDLPIEQPVKFDLVINLKTAKALGLTISPSVLQRADSIIDK